MRKWRVVPSFPWLEASSDGRVRRTLVALNGMRPREIEGAIDKRGYIMLCIQRGNIRRGNIGKHVLICEAFHGLRPSPAHLVAHWDGDSTNNVPSNLRWATEKENAADRTRHGHTLRGTDVNTAKLNEFVVLEMRRLAKEEGFTGKQLGEMFGVDRNHATRVLNGKCWAHVTLDSFLAKYDPDGRHRAFNAELERCVAIGIRISPTFSQMWQPPVNHLSTVADRGQLEFEFLESTRSRRSASHRCFIA